MSLLTNIRVAVVAKGEVVRHGFARMLEKVAYVDEFDVFEPEEFAEGSADALQLLILSCRVLILWCADGSGLGADAWAAELSAVVRKYGITVVMVLPAAEAKRAASGSWMAVPCDGVLDQDALTTESLSEALRRLASGERLEAEPPAPALLRPGPDDAVFPAGPPITTLTARERQVLELLVDGLSNKQIGQALALSEHGAKRLVAIVLSKLNCPNRTQAAAVALREGLVGGVRPLIRQTVGAGRGSARA